jgi:hypothetical protein
MDEINDIRRFAVESAKPGYWARYWAWVRVIDPGRVISPIFLTTATRRRAA